MTDRGHPKNAKLFYLKFIQACQGSLILIRLRLRLGEENEMEWKGMKIIILEYSSISLFGSFNGGNGKPIPLFGSLSRNE